jgi:hypothetical protein
MQNAGFAAACGAAQGCAAISKTQVFEMKARRKPRFSARAEMQSHGRLLHHPVGSRGNPA